MSQQLFVAEADKIQDFVFRAAHLSEIVGGSQLLTQFCRDVPQQLLNGANKIIVSDGGKFVILFDSQPAAHSFGEKLAEAYRRVAGGSLTFVSVPFESNLGDVLDTAEKKLREAKLCTLQSLSAVDHLPYLALCSSCGVAPAISYGKFYPDSDLTERKKYLCVPCQTKAKERQLNAGHDERDHFFRPFINKVMGDNTGYPDWTTRPKHISRYDRRRYVAYLIADGNNMGQIVHSCQKTDQMKNLSKRMEDVLRESLAVPTRLIKNHLPKEGFKVPVLPLILGGDDVFALLPARWALSFALEFCQTFEIEMERLLDDLELKPQVKPGMSVAMVICKETYPHALAHQVGQECLNQAKQLSKSNKPSMSTINFLVISGTQVNRAKSGAKNRPTLRPYFAPTAEGENLPDRAGLPIQRLLEHRHRLVGTPRRQLNQLRRHFDTLLTIDRRDWQDELNKIISRITRRESDKLTPIEQAITDLGSSREGRLFSPLRQYDPDFSAGHGLPDLLEVWDFAFDLNKSPSDYEEAS